MRLTEIPVEEAAKEVAKAMFDAACHKVKALCDSGQLTPDNSDDAVTRALIGTLAITACGIGNSDAQREMMDKLYLICGYEKGECEGR